MIEFQWLAVKDVKSNRKYFINVYFWVCKFGLSACPRPPLSIGCGYRQRAFGATFLSAVEMDVFR